MGLPRITYNGKTIDFPRDVAEPFNLFPMRSALRNMSASGRCETLNVSSGYSVSAKLSGLSNATDAALKTSLFQAMQWAEAGEEWVFNRNSAVTVNTTLDGAAIVGVTSIPVVGAAGIVSGSRYVIESKTQVATVKATNSGTDPVTISAGLDFAFAAGSRFRAYEYLPMVGSIRVTEHTNGLYFDVEISGQIDRRAL